MNAGRWARLLITDGTETFDLLNSPVCLKDWEPAIAQKREIRQQSFQSDGSIPVDYSWDNINDVFVLNMKGKDGDALARSLQDLHRLLLKGLAYWKTSWQKEPVWIETRAQHETNIRYAQVVSFQTEKDNNPFAQPYFAAKSYRREFQLGIEHALWKANAPGDSDCVQISGTQDWAISFPLVFDGDTQDVTVPAAASINDLPDGGPITVHGWIKADSYGEGNNARIIVKGSDSTSARGWHLFLVFPAGEALLSQVCCATRDALSYSSFGSWKPDSEWHYILMTYSETGVGLPAARTIYLNIDGAWVTYQTQITSQGAYDADAADDMIIGNNAAGTRGFDGEEGWMEVAAGIIHSPANGDFTPPPRCPLPFPDTNSVFLGIKEGSGTSIVDQSGQGNDGTAANDAWGDVCEATFGRTATCLDEVYIANKHNMAQLTNIHINDGGVWGGNLLGAATPFNLLPAAPANGDAIYFGIDTTVANSGPFCSLVLDIGTAATYGAGDSLDWEFWAGAWVPLTTQDNTNADGLGTGSAFDTTGVNSVHWKQNPTWVTNDPGVGVTGYWVRAVLTEVTGATPATQQNRAIYSILWPHIDITADQVLGDIEGLARVIAKNQSDNDVIFLDASRILIALRSLDRGADFTPYINLADEQNNANITIALGVAAAYTNNVETPTGRQVTLTNPAAAWNSAIEIQFDAAFAPQYKGEFHAYMRGEQTSGVAGDLEFRLISRMGSATGYSRTAKNTVSFGIPNVSDIVLDFGAIKMPPTDTLSDADTTETTLIIEVYGNGAADADLYDLILLPVDEWIGDYEDVNSQFSWNGRHTAAEQAKLDVDSIGYPKDMNRALLRVDPSNNIQDIYKPKATPIILQANQAQRLWFFMIKNNPPDVIPYYNVAEHEISGSTQSFISARYIAARGNR